MKRVAKIFYKEMLAGKLSEEENGYVFQYDSDYLANEDAQPVSLTLPLSKDPYVSKTMFSFFDGLIPEGWLLDIASESWKIDIRDRMGLLLTCCKDCIGAVSVIPAEENVNE